MSPGTSPNTAPTREELDREIRRLSARRSRRSFLIMGAAALGGYEFYQWIGKSPSIGRLQLPLRRAEEFNAALFRQTFRERGLAPTYPIGKAEYLRFNGIVGMNTDLDLSSWRLQLTGIAHPESYPQYTEDVGAWVYRSRGEAPATPEAKLNSAKLNSDDAKGPIEAPRKKGKKKNDGAPHTLLGRPKGTPNGKGPIQLNQAQNITVTSLPFNMEAFDRTPGLLLTMDDIRKLPHQELVTQFKCIEGWSQIVHWGGVRLADLIEAYPPAKTAAGGEPRYVYMETPDGEYYCGYDMDACKHPQSLLAYEMSGELLNQWHGAPLRLHMPIKYGYKQLKQIGLIRYTDTRPEDFWAKLGYDWYAGL